MGAAGAGSSMSMVRGARPRAARRRGSQRASGGRARAQATRDDSTTLRVTNISTDATVCARGDMHSRMRVWARWCVRARRAGGSASGVVCVCARARACGTSDERALLRQDNDLRDLFGRCGHISRVYLVRAGHCGARALSSLATRLSQATLKDEAGVVTSRGFAFISYHTKCVLVVFAGARCAQSVDVAMSQARRAERY